MTGSRTTKGSEPRSGEILRPVRPDDAGALWGLLEQSKDELVGMTSLPSSSDAAVAACSSSTSVLADLAAGTFELNDGELASLLFALVETTGDRQLLGVTGVTFKQAVPNLAVRVVTSRDGLGLDMASFSSPWTRTELNSSLMSSTARGRGLGGLLSRGRLMFLHQVQRQVPSTVASHVRGRFEEDGSAPFWRCFGSHFAPNWENSMAAERALAADPSRLDDLIGHRRPVTADVLHSLGPVNRASLPAFRVLMREGLRPNGMYDPIDGGPTLVAERANTTTGKARTSGRVRWCSDRGPTDALVAVTSVDEFRVARLPVDVSGSDTVGITEADGVALAVSPGSLLAVAPLPRPHASPAGEPA